MDAVFDWLDPALSWWRSAEGRLTVGAAAAGALSMIFYSVAAPQARIQRVQRIAARVQNRLRSYDGDFSGAMRLARRNVALALKRLGLSAGPSLLAGLPVMLAMIWTIPALERQAPGAWAWLGSATIAYFMIAAVAALATKLLFKIA